jgi:hypothetical protein
VKKALPSSFASLSDLRAFAVNPNPINNQKSPFSTHQSLLFFLRVFLRALRTLRVSLHPKTRLAQSPQRNPQSPRRPGSSNLGPLSSLAVKKSSPIFLSVPQRPPRLCGKSKSHQQSKISIHHSPIPLILPPRLPPRSPNPPRFASSKNPLGANPANKPKKSPVVPPLQTLAPSLPWR